MQDKYELLGVSPSAPVSVIKAAYRQLCKESHPDVNRSAGATRRMQALNAAHEVLTDPVRRSAYDRQRREQAHVHGAANSSVHNTAPPPRPAAASPPRNRPEPDPTPRDGEAFAADCACAKCGRLDASLRLTVFTWVVSMVVLSWRRDWARLLCGGCRLRYGLLFNLEVFLFGFWGFPWGMLWSIAALIRNATGYRGRELTTRNAALLRELGRVFLVQGRNDEALRTLRESLRLRAEDADTAALLDQARRRVPAAAEAKLAGFGLPPALVHAGVLGVVLLVLTLVLGQQPLRPGGAGARGHGSAAPSTDWSETMRRSQGAVVTLLVFDAEENQIATGSGFFVSATGHIVTNHHVIEDAAQVVARLTDGREFLAKGILADSAAKDLALLDLHRVNPEPVGPNNLPDLISICDVVGPKGKVFSPLGQSEKLPFLRLVDYDMTSPGARVAVIGSPLGLAGTLSEGILSANREVEGCRMLQISAPLSPGSSGSPVLDSRGDVIGVATMASKAGYQNLNFAVVAGEVRELVRGASATVTNFAAWRSQGVPARGAEVTGRPESTPFNAPRGVPAQVVELNAEAIRLANEGMALKALKAMREAARLAPADATIRANLAFLEARGGMTAPPVARALPVTTPPLPTGEGELPSLIAQARARRVAEGPATSHRGDLLVRRGPNPKDEFEEHITLSCADGKSPPALLCTHDWRTGQLTFSPDDFWIIVNETTPSGGTEFRLFRRTRRNLYEEIKTADIVHRAAAEALRRRGARPEVLLDHAYAHLQSWSADSGTIGFEIWGHGGGFGSLNRTGFSYVLGRASLRELPLPGPAVPSGSPTAQAASDTARTQSKSSAQVQLPLAPALIPPAAARDSDRQLNAAYSDLHLGLDASGRAKLKASQLSWLRQRATETGSADLLAEGEEAQQWALKRFIEMNENRTATLRQNRIE